MPRPRKTNQIGGEETLARRIAHERERRGWSYEVLAREMTAAGCPVAGSALHRVEKGDPRRRVPVDELVALASVFGVSIENLLTPLELVRKERAREVVESIEEAETNLTAIVEAYLAAWVELWELAADDHDLFEYVTNHITGGAPAPTDVRLVEVGGVEVDTGAFEEAYAAFLVAAWNLAGDAVEASLATEEG